jgi:hypothetical protein
MRAILAAVLMLAATSASAEWVKVAETAGVAYYVDPMTITKDGAARKVSALQDYAKAQAGGARSRQLSLEIDCAGERLRGLTSADHAEPMSGGAVLGTADQPSEWIQVEAATGSNIPRRTPNLSIIRFVCSR